MRIHHIAVYVRDMAVVSEFIEKYFEANRIDLYNNPTTGFSSRFIHFQDGARLELMHRPDVQKPHDSLLYGCYGRATMLALENRQQAADVNREEACPSYRIVGHTYLSIIHKPILF